MKTIKLLRQKAIKLAQKTHVTLASPSKSQAQCALFVFGVCILAMGLTEAASAQAAGVPNPSQITYNDTRIRDAIETVLAYIEGTIGAMVMIAAGIGAIFSSAFGQYKAALGLLVVAVGAFILRSLVDTFFEVPEIR